ncbi:hypothetical protein [Nocardia sp. NPDC023988]|uniref:hypothetical protein n=1 Tax=unclassified Nocardia TaxID=2637762 RepID=UPI0033CA4B0A
MDENWMDERHQKEAEQYRVWAGRAYEEAEQADQLGDTERAQNARERAASHTRNAELYERIAPLYQFRGFASVPIKALGTEIAMQLLDRFDSVSSDSLLRNADRDGHASARVAELQKSATEWALGNAMRTGALREISRIVRLMEDQGVEVNLAALARMTGISRQTLYAHLRQDRTTEH